MENFDEEEEDDVDCWWWWLARLWEGGIGSR